MQIFHTHKIHWIIFAIIIFNATYNLVLFPEFFWDQGVYVQRAIDFAKTLHTYSHSGYIDHPPLGWILPATIFFVTGYPDSIINTHTDLESKIFFLSLIPRLVAVSYIIPIAILVYKIAMRYYENRKFALVSLSVFTLVPSFWPFRDMLLDPLMILFVLLSLYCILKNDRKNSSLVLLFSGFFFGCAILTKFSAVFFLPVLVYVVLQNSNKFQKIGIWFAPFIVTMSIFFISLSNQHILGQLVSTQIWQVNRGSALPYGVALRILATMSPVALVFGICGIIHFIKNKNAAVPIFSIPYLAFLFRGGFVGFVHVIPIIPILSIFAGKPLYDFGQKISKRNQDNTKYFATLLVVILASSIAITIWIGSFDASKAQRDAISYLVKTLPENSTLVTNPGYGVMIKQLRPDITVTDYFEFNFFKKIPNEVFFAESSSPSQRDPTLTQTQSIYQRSCDVVKFEQKAPFIHPYSLPSDMPWNVFVRHYNEKGCQ